MFWLTLGTIAGSQLKKQTTKQAQKVGLPLSTSLSVAFPSISFYSYCTVWGR